MTERNAQRAYRATFSVTVDIVVPDEAITRVLENEEGWRDTFYNLDERGVVEMIARCCGINGARLSQLDGWADLHDQLLLKRPEGRIVSCDMDEYERIPVEKAVA